jgi:alkylhydroperoxidase/carboxymuconolactone decarboxylase family protein YurZ
MPTRAVSGCNEAPTSEGTAAMAKHEDALRCMALGDERYIKDVLAMQLTNVDASGLDPKTHALVRLGALIALDASQSSFQWNAATALASGATVDEIVGVLIAVAQTVGLARVASAAPAVALALGYDIDAALEAHDEGERVISGERR